MAEVWHKPEVMQMGVCPGCLKNRVCVLLTPRDKPNTERVHYIRTHDCGERLLPKAGTLRSIQSGDLLTPRPKRRGPKA